MKLFHGTSADSAKQILQHGFSTDAKLVWNCSGSAVYFWSPTELEKHNEAENESDAEFCARQRAFDSATCALPRAKDCRVVIFEVEIIDAESVAPDESCDNMEGAVCVYDDVPATAICRAWISEDLSLVKGSFLAGMCDRNLSALNPTRIEEKIAAIFAKAEIYPDEIEEIANLNEISLDELAAAL